MISYQVLQLARFCKEAGITKIVGSPGSRSAPILIALVRIGGIEVEMEMDERSAAYKALGLSLALNKPVGLFCTSGTAVLNYGPAIAEAFYQNVPLFIFTADRPAEMIDQNEGQAVRQNGIFSLHTKFSALIPSTDGHIEAGNHTRRLLNQALFLALQHPQGPVHLNFPLREPLYPTMEIDFTEINNTNQFIKTSSSRHKLNREELSELIEIWNKSGKRLVVAGQMKPEPELNNALKALSEYGLCPVLGDCLHNLNFSDGLVLSADSFPKSFFQDSFAEPEILLTIGNGILSKSIRTFLKRIKPRHHWHVCENGFPPDPYGTITRIVQADPSWFLTKLGEASFFAQPQQKTNSESFFTHWFNKEKEVRNQVELFSEKTGWSDLTATKSLLKNISSNTILFLGNSMPVRYANWFSYLMKPLNLIYSNRGTSGIDGCVSTSVGIAKVYPDRLVVALVGDMSFIYDRNALWSQNLPNNLKIIVLNNAGGNIFRIIPGSGNMPELKTYFELNQPFSAGNAARESGLEYYEVTDLSLMEKLAPAFLKSSKSGILECFTDPEMNARVVKEFINQLET